MTTYFLLGKSNKLKLENGELYACGNNQFGQLGVGNSQEYQVPVLLDFFKGKKIKNIKSGYHTLFLMDKCSLKDRN